MCIYKRDEDNNLFPTPGAFVKCYDYRLGWGWGLDDDSTGRNGCARVYYEKKSWDDYFVGNK